MAAKKKTATKKSTPKGKSTAVRHTPIPQVEAVTAPAVRVDVTTDMIARRAYEIWTVSGGSELDNWTAAESELRAA